MYMEGSRSRSAVVLAALSYYTVHPIYTAIGVYSVY